MNLSEGSSYKGAINTDYAGTVKLTLSKDSKLSLTGDCYVDKLDDQDKTYSNIEFNGYKIYVKGKDVLTNKKTTKKKTKTKAVGSSDNNQPPQGDNGNAPEPPTDSDGNPAKPPKEGSGQQPEPPTK